MKYWKIVIIHVGKSYPSKNPKKIPIHMMIIKSHMMSINTKKEKVMKRYLEKGSKKY